MTRRPIMRKRSVFITLSGTVAMALGVLMLSQTVMTAAQKERDDQRNDNGRPKPPPGQATYNPYPPGILPADVTTELDRVRREVRFILNKTLAAANALPPPVLTGHPPTLQGTGFQAVQILGKLLNFDENMSPNRNVACASCHMPYAGFSGPIPSVNLTMIAYPGSARFQAGKRTPEPSTQST